MTVDNPADYVSTILPVGFGVIFERWLHCAHWSDYDDEGVRAVMSSAQ